MLKSSQALTKLSLTVMSFLKSNNYMSILPPISIALDFWDPISTEFPSEAAAGPEQYWEKPGCRLLLMCPCSLTLKNHHQAYWKMFQWFKVIVFFFSRLLRTSLVAQMVKNLPTMQEAQVRSLVWDDPLEKAMATHCSILSWRIPWAEEPGGLQSMGSQRVGHN